MESSVTVAIIQAVQGLLIVVLGGAGGAALRSIKRDAAATREQVENNHKDPESGKVINLREEADERHDENKGLLLQILQSVNWLLGRALSNTDRIEDLEEQTGQTQSRRARRIAAETPPIITGMDLPGPYPVTRKGTQP